MVKCLNKLHSAEETQQERGQDGMYEMVEGGKPAEAEYEILGSEHNPLQLLLILTHSKILFLSCIIYLLYLLF